MARKKKSVAVIVIAVLNLVLGIPCLICMPTSLIMSEAMKGMAKPNAGAGPNDPFGQIEEQEKFMEKESPGFKAMQYVSAAVYVLFALALIISATLLLMSKPAGRYLCIAACICFALWMIGHSAYQVAFVLPASKKYMDKRFHDMKATPPPKGIFEAGTAVGLGFNLFVGVGYPLLAIALLMTSGAREALTKRRRAAPEDLRDEDYDDYEDRRLRDYDER